MTFWVHLMTFSWLLIFKVSNQNDFLTELKFYAVFFSSGMIIMIFGWKSRFIWFGILTFFHAYFFDDSEINDVNFSTQHQIKTCPCWGLLIKMKNFHLWEWFFSWMLTELISKWDDTKLKINTQCSSINISNPLKNILTKASTPRTSICEFRENWKFDTSKIPKSWYEYFTLSQELNND